jgi:hypothetical protein
MTQNNYINFNKKTVFVVGAGASLPYGYPLGADLVDNIIKAAKKINNPLADKLIERIKFHDPLSIDSFLAQHCAGKENEYLSELGKQLIAECILACEDREAISEKGRQIVYNKETKKYERGNENWYRYLAHAMFEDKDRLINEPLPFKIITFNYDVSLDYYLLERVWRATMLSLDEKKKVLEKLRDAIIHVYGAVREVPWNNPEVLDKFEVHLNKNNKKYYVNGFNEQYKKFVTGYEIEKTYIDYIYGSHNSTNQIMSQGNYHVCQGERQPNLGEIECGLQLISKAAKRIKVIDERNEQIEENLKPFKQYIVKEAQRIMFLGFGFDKQNMDLLFDKKTIRNGSLTRCGEICYTNFDDSEKLHRRINGYFTSGQSVSGINFNHFKSIKGVYEALTQDFDLD